MLSNEINRIAAVKRVEDAIRGFLQRYGSPGVKRGLWNFEYRRGRWNCLNTMTQDCVYPFIERYAGGGNILDLGCGPGAVGNELNPLTYRWYTGVDISDEAIREAMTRSEQRRLNNKQEYRQSDILAYMPDKAYQVIFFGDSIYYFTDQQIPAILDRYSNYLEETGVFIVRSWIARARHRSIISKIEAVSDVIERRSFYDDQMAVLVFRPLPPVAFFPFFR